MSTLFCISNYCIIRDHAIVMNDNIQYSAMHAGFHEFITGAYQHLTVSYPKFHKMDNLSKLGFLSVELLLRDKNLNQQFNGSDIGIMLMNASSSLDTDKVHQNAILDRLNYFPSPAVFVYTLPNIVIGEICIRHKITGEGTFFIQEKFDTAFFYKYIKNLFELGIIQCCIAGWIEIEGEEYDSVVYLIEKTDRPNNGIANFEPSAIQKIYSKEK
jgi:hypothetical protein